MNIPARTALSKHSLRPLSATAMTFVLHSGLPVQLSKNVIRILTTGLDSCYWTDNLLRLQSNPRVKCQGLRSVEDIHKLFTGDGLFFEEVPRAFVHLVDVGGDDVGGFFLGGGDHLADFGVDVSGSLVRAGQLR